MKKIRITALILALSLIMTAFAGCSKPGEEKDSGNGEKVPVTNEAGEVVTDENGDTVYTEEEKKDPEDTDTPAPVTNEAGEVVTDEKGETVTAESSGAKENSGEKTTEIYIPAETLPPKDPADAKLPEGVTIDSVSIFELDGSVNLELEITNTKSFEQLADLSYLVLKLNDETEIKHLYTNVPIGAQRTIKCSLPIDDPDVPVGAGSMIFVYFGYELLETATVRRF